MSYILDSIFADVCLDERIPDGIFRMDEAEHMNALRDYFINKGLAKEDAIHVTNRMIEGKYPDRQAYRVEDGILVTWPSQKHKQKAMRENPGKYIEENPFPKKSDPHVPSDKIEKNKTQPLDTNEPDNGKLGSSQEEMPDVDRPRSNLFEPDTPVQQGNKQLSVEPVPGTPAAQAAQVQQQPQQQPIQKTPPQIAAEKEIVKQMIKHDNSALTNISNPIAEAYRQEIINELYKRATAAGLVQVKSFLEQYIFS